jgi:hypothetical protein
MLKIITVNNKYPAHVFVICEACGIEVDIINIGMVDKLYEEGWTKKNEYNMDASKGEKFKVFHWCSKCSLERENKL